MPIHFDDLDVAPQVDGLNSALIVPCNMCPAVTVAIRENKPFIRLFRSPLKSAPFEGYLESLQSQLRNKGLKAKVFRNRLFHHWFLCMWPSSRRKKLQRYAGQFDAVIVLGCDSAVEIVRDLVKSTNCRVVEGMKVAGITNAKLKFRLPGNVSFEDCRIVPICQG